MYKIEEMDVLGPMVTVDKNQKTTFPVTYYSSVRNVVTERFFTKNKSTQSLQATLHNWTIKHVDS